MTSSLQIPTIDLAGEVSIPQFGLGVFQVPPEDTAENVLQAIEVGYRHIDTAKAYGNEAEVGQAVRASGLDRARVLHHHEAAGTATTATTRPSRALKTSLGQLEMDHVDLYLIHWPVPVAGPLRRDLAGAHRGAAGRASRAPSASRTSSPPHLRRIVDETGVTPAVNQIELHPLPAAGRAAPRARRPRHRHRGVEPARRRARCSTTRSISEIAEAHGKTPGAGRAALAHPARQRRVPEVGDARADRGEHRHLRLRALRRRDGAHRGRSTAASGPGPTRTRSSGRRSHGAARAVGSSA